MSEGSTASIEELLALLDNKKAPKEEPVITIPEVLTETNNALSRLIETNMGVNTNTVPNDFFATTLNSLLAINADTREEIPHYLLSSMYSSLIGFWFQNFRTKNSFKERLQELAPILTNILNDCAAQEIPPVKPAQAPTKKYTAFERLIPPDISSQIGMVAVQERTQLFQEQVTNAQSIQDLQSLILAQYIIDTFPKKREELLKSIKDLKEPYEFGLTMIARLADNTGKTDNAVSRWRHAKTDRISTLHKLELGARQISENEDRKFRATVNAITTRVNEYLWPDQIAFPSRNKEQYTEWRKQLLQKMADAFVIDSSTPVEGDLVMMRNTIIQYEAPPPGTVGLLMENNTFQTIHGNKKNVQLEDILRITRTPNPSKPKYSPGSRVKALKTKNAILKDMTGIIQYREEGLAFVDFSESTNERGPVVLMNLNNLESVIPEYKYPQNPLAGGIIIPIGQRVQIKKTSQYTDQSEFPGKVTAMLPFIGELFPLTITFDNGHQNRYPVSELDFLDNPKLVTAIDEYTKKSDEETKLNPDYTMKIQEKLEEICKEAEQQAKKGFEDEKTILLQTIDQLLVSGISRNTLNGLSTITKLRKTIPALTTGLTCWEIISLEDRTSGLLSSVQQEFGILFPDKEILPQDHDPEAWARAIIQSHKISDKEPALGDMILEVCLDGKQHIGTYAACGCGRNIVKSTEGGKHVRGTVKKLVLAYPEHAQKVIHPEHLFRAGQEVMYTGRRTDKLTEKYKTARDQNIPQGTIGQVIRLLRENIHVRFDNDKTQKTWFDYEIELEQGVWTYAKEELKLTTSSEETKKEPSPAQELLQELTQRMQSLIDNYATQRKDLSDPIQTTLRTITDLTTLGYERDTITMLFRENVPQTTFNKLAELRIFE